MESYNNTYHRTIKRAPINVKPENVNEIYQLYKQKNILLKEKNKLNVGDIVRVVLDKKVFTRGFTVNWSKDLYIIDRRIDKLPFSIYIIKDLQGNVLKRRFYYKELQKIDPNFLRERIPKKIINTRGLGKNLEYLVNFLNDTNTQKSPAWISAREYNNHYNGKT